MVASAYQKLPTVGEPYEVKGRMYIKVRLNDRSTKIVRWYTEEEFKRLFPKSAEPVLRWKTTKQIFGFDKGYIMLIVGDCDINEEWLKASPARFTRYWNWFFESTVDYENIKLPEGLALVQLNWDDVSRDGTTLIPENELKKVAESKMYLPGNSKYQGSIGDKLDLIVTIKSVTKVDSYYGSKSFHVMEDDNGNAYIWNASTKTLDVDGRYHLVGTVKSFGIYKNNEQTELTRCLIREKLS